MHNIYTSWDKLIKTFGSQVIIVKDILKITCIVGHGKQKSEI